MSLLNIDQDKCKQDGLRATDCPMGIIRFKGKESFPEILPESEPMCIRCGHCVAVCPHGALDHAEVPLAACTVIDQALVIPPAHAGQFLRSRRSVRRFKDKPVEQPTLQRLIETARYAPKASNSQLMEWLVINDLEFQGHLAEFQSDFDFAKELSKVSPEIREIPRNPKVVRKRNSKKELFEYSVYATWKEEKKYEPIFLMSNIQGENS